MLSGFMRALVFIGTALLPSVASAIECWRAKTPTEIAICSNPPLKAFDDFLSEAYASVRRAVPHDVFNEVRKDQIRWIRERDAKCGGNVPCLMQEAQTRTAMLNGFAQRYAEQLTTDRAPEQAEPPTSITAPSATPLDPRDIYRKAAQSVVVVVGVNVERSKVSQGSGVVIAQDMVATNCHVLESVEAVVVMYRDKPYRAISVSGDRALDYCIIRTIGLPARPVETASISTITPGQRVYSVGSPRGLELTIAEGLISGLRKKDGVPLPLIQTSAAISPGSSGGGLFDEHGRVIGITTFLLRDAQNINFALPVELYRTVRAP